MKRTETSAGSEDQRGQSSTYLEIIQYIGGFGHAGLIKDAQIRILATLPLSEAQKIIDEILDTRGQIEKWDSKKLQQWRKERNRLILEAKRRVSTER